MTDIEKLDLEYQYTMLARHVKDFLEEIVHYDTYNEGLYQIVDDDLEPMRKRLATIRAIQDKAEKECEAFAQMPIWDDADTCVVNSWPSSQLCMDCKHGTFIMSEDMPASTYTCSQGVQLGPCDSHCIMLEEK